MRRVSLLVCQLFIVCMFVAPLLAEEGEVSQTSLNPKDRAINATLQALAELSVEQGKKMLSLSITHDLREKVCGYERFEEDNSDIAKMLSQLAESEESEKNRKKIIGAIEKKFNIEKVSKADDFLWDTKKEQQRVIAAETRKWIWRAFLYNTCKTVNGNIEEGVVSEDLIAAIRKDLTLIGVFFAVMDNKAVARTFSNKKSETMRDMFSGTMSAIGGSHVDQEKEKKLTFVKESLESINDVKLVDIKATFKGGKTYDEKINQLKNLFETLKDDSDKTLKQNLMKIIETVNPGSLGWSLVLAVDFVQEIYETRRNIAQYLEPAIEMIYFSWMDVPVKDAIPKVMMRSSALNKYYEQIIEPAFEIVPILKAGNLVKGNVKFEFTKDTGVINGFKITSGFIKDPEIGNHVCKLNSNSLFKLENNGKCVYAHVFSSDTKLKHYEWEKELYSNLLRAMTDKDHAKDYLRKSIPLLIAKSTLTYLEKKKTKQLDIVFKSFPAMEERAKGYLASLVWKNPKNPEKIDEIFALVTYQMLYLYEHPEELRKMNAAFDTLMNGSSYQRFTMLSSLIVKAVDTSDRDESDRNRGALKGLKALKMTVALSQVENKDDAKSILEQHVADANLRTVRYWDHSFSLGTLLGGGAGWSFPSNSPNGSGKLGANLFMPFGLTYTKGWFGAQAHLLDLGQYTSYGGGGTNGYNWREAIAPGLSIFGRMRRYPFAIGVDYTYKTRPKTSALPNDHEIKFFIAVDIPLFYLD